MTLPYLIRHRTCCSKYTDVRILFAATVRPHFFSAPVFPIRPHILFSPSRISHTHTCALYARTGNYSTRTTRIRLNYELIKKVDVSRGDGPRTISPGYSDVISVSRYDLECQNEISVEIYVRQPCDRYRPIALKLESIVEQIGVCHWRRLANRETDRKKDFVRRIL